MTSRTVKLRAVFMDIFAKKKKLNAKFSLRAFARDLKISPATLSRLMNGKGNLSEAIIRDVTLALKLDDKTAKSILEKEYDPYDAITDVSLPEVRSLIEHWYYYAILSLAELDHFESDPNWIAKRLNISPSAAAAAIKDLVQLQLLIPGKTAKTLVASGKHLTFSGKFPPQIDARRSKVELLQKASEVLRSKDEDVYHATDFSSITMAIDKNKIPEAKIRLQRFRRSLAKYLNSGNESEVYVLALQLFPVSHSVKTRR